MRLSFLIVLVLFGISAFANDPSLKLAQLKYRGGGDWYANPTSLRNLSLFCNKHLGTNLDPNYAIVEPGSPNIYNYPFLHLSGHGNVIFTDAEAENLRKYLEAGGFLHISDNYGMDPYIRLAMKKVFPEREFIELPWDHPIYSHKFTFKKGLPKIHEHNGKPPQGFGIFHEGRLVCFYDHECDLSDGWEDQEVHNDPEHIRLQALQMGANLVKFAFIQ